MVASFDYIIIGGGSAGCVLAARLSEDREVRVLLVEAGGADRNILYHVPAGFARMTKGIGSWGWSTVPQRHMRDRVFWYTQAKVIGGGSSINAQIYTRGHPIDYDGWAQSGATGWSYREVLPYFRRAEDNDTWDDAYHGQGGPIGVSKPISPLPICEAYFAAAAKLGIPFNADLAGDPPDGVGYYQLTQRHARRSSTARTYLKVAKQRGNFQLLLASQVTRIVVEKGRAVGVELVDPTEGPVTLCADREIILTAGAIGSPKLLMHSGIGPAEHLRSVGIAPVHDLPGVGSNLQDHLDISTIWECTGDHSYDKYIKPGWGALAGAQWLLTGKGPAASCLFETGGFVRADKSADAPDIQFHFGLGSGIEAGIAKLKNPGVTLNSAFMRPRSRGTVRLASSDLGVPPLIDPNYWEDPYDRHISLAGLKLARELLRQEPMRPFLQGERVPGEAIQGDDELFAYACRSAKTDHHPAATCAMGRGAMAVLDPELRMHGLAGLRVCDASAMPFVVASNTNAAVIMIAEKAADMIRGRSPLAATDLPARRKLGAVA